MALSRGAKIGLIIGSSIALIGGGILIYRRFFRKPNEVLRDVFDNLTFETNKDVIKSESFPYLDELAMVLTKAPKWKIQITGHTDSVGKDESNLILSQKRAESVKKYLVSKGVIGEKIQTFGMGETMPIDTNDTAEGLSLIHI